MPLAHFNILVYESLKLHHRLERHMQSYADFRNQAVKGATITAYFPALRLVLKRSIISAGNGMLRFSDGAVYEFAPAAHHEFMDDCIICYPPTAHNCPLVVYTFLSRLPPCVRFKIDQKYQMAAGGGMVSI